jgi:hypothetical protein
MFLSKKPFINWQLTDESNACEKRFGLIIPPPFEASMLVSLQQDSGTMA